MQLVKTDAVITSTVVPFKQKSVRGKLWAVLPWALFGVACGLLLAGLIVYYADAVDHEMASELILAKMLSEGKGFILTNQWAYSSEIRFLNTQLIFAPLFWIFKSWAVVRIVGTVILHVIFLLAFYFFLASIQQKRLFPWLAIFLMLPLGIDWVRYVNFGTYYIPHFAIALTVWGLIFYALRTSSSKCRNWLVAGAAVLSLGAGVGGYRMVVMLSIPLFLTAVIYWLLNLTTEHHAMAVKFLAIGAITGGVAVVGLLINVLLHNWFIFNAFDNLRWCNFNWDGLVAVFMMVLTAFGYREGAIFGGGGQPCPTWSRSA